MTDVYYPLFHTRIICWVHCRGINYSLTRALSETVGKTPKKLLIAISFCCLESLMKAAEASLIINRQLIQLKIASILDDGLMDEKNPVERFYNGLLIVDSLLLTTCWKVCRVLFILSEQSTKR